MPIGLIAAAARGGVLSAANAHFASAAGGAHSRPLPTKSAAAKHLAHGVVRHGAPRGRAGACRVAPRFDFAAPGRARRRTPSSCTIVAWMGRCGPGPEPKSPASKAGAGALSFGATEWEHRAVLRVKPATRPRQLGQER